MGGVELLLSPLGDVAHDDIHIPLTYPLVLSVVQKSKPRQRSATVLENSCKEVRSRTPPEKQPHVSNTSPSNVVARVAILCYHSAAIYKENAPLLSRQQPFNSCKHFLPVNLIL